MRQKKGQKKSQAKKKESNKRTQKKGEENSCSEEAEVKSRIEVKKINLISDLNNSFINISYLEISETRLYESFSRILEWAEETEQIFDCQPWFRGVNSLYPLLPSLYRKKAGTVEKGKFMFNEFCQIIEYDHTLGNLDRFDLYAVAAHYGLPTRLLDWTTSLLHSLFFSIHKFSIRKAGSPAIWALNPKTINNISAPEFNKRLVLSTKSIVQNYIDLEDKKYSLPIAVFPKWNNQRIAAQKGMFTLHGYDRLPLEDLSRDIDLRCLIIPKDLVKEIKYGLDHFGFTVGSVFRDLDNFTKDIRKSFKYDK